MTAKPQTSDSHVSKPATPDHPADSPFAVIRFGPGWRVIHNGASRGMYDYQIDAIEAALRLAREAAPPGEALNIMVQDPGGGLTPLRVA